MEVNSISGNTAAAGTNNTTAAAKNNSFSMEDFFTLLAAQLQNQSMFNPVEDTEFMGQMAQFSSLQQMQELTKTFGKMMSLSMVGKTVSAQITDAANKTAVISGKVSGVELSGGKSFLCIGPYLIDPDNVISITE